MEIDEKPESSKPDRKWIAEKVRSLFQGGEDTDNEHRLRRYFREWLLANHDAVPHLVAAFRFSGVLDFVGDAGANKHAALMRLFANLLIDDDERSKWNTESPLGVLYNSIGDGLSEAGNSLIRQSSVREASPIQAIIWCAFADGAYLGVDRGPEWPGVINHQVAKDIVFVPWVFEGRGEGATTTYGKYLDALYDNLDRRSDALDIVFADIISLSELADRALIDTLDGNEVLTDQTGLKPLGLGRIDELGALVTINYHVPAVSTKYYHAKTDRPASIAIHEMMEKNQADRLFTFSSSKDSVVSSKVEFTDLHFKPSFECNDISHIKELLNDLFIGNEQQKQPRYDRGLELAEFGPDHPICPIQLASGAHATYTTFALFANCGQLRSFVQQDLLLPSKHKAWLFRSSDSSGNWQSAKEIVNDPNINGRGGRALLIPDLESLVERAILVFNFIWFFVPATALVYDHVSSALARRNCYVDRWFDPCLPVESVLFHETDWSAPEQAANLADRPATLDGATLSCLGGYSLALSTKSFHREGAKQKLRALKAQFVKSVPAGSAFHRISPSKLTASELVNMSVRPVLNFWPLLDSIVSDTVRLYATALFSMRTLRALSEASLQGGYEGHGPSEWCNFYLKNASADLRRQFTGYFGTDRTVSPDTLYEALIENVRHGTVHQLLSATQQQAAQQLIYLLGGDTAHIEFARNGMKSLLADSDYISGIVRSHHTLGSLAKQFVDTIVAKLEATARARHWALLHVKAAH